MKYRSWWQLLRQRITWQHPLLLNYFSLVLEPDLVTANSRIKADSLLIRYENCVSR